MILKQNSQVDLILLGYAFVKWKIVHVWLGWLSIFLELASMIVIMAIPDSFEIYKPLFYVKFGYCCWGLPLYEKALIFPRMGLKF